MSDGARIRISPLGETLQALSGENLRQTLLRHGIHLESPCNGEGICGQCGVWVQHPQQVPATPHRKITPEQEEQGLRLSCRVVPQSDLAIRLPEDFSRDAQRIRQSQQILEGERLSWTRVASAVRVFQDEQGQWRVHYHGLKEAIHLPDWREGLDPLGLAVDLGTTAIVLTLVSLSSGQELATASGLNPQSMYGQDAISRIQHGSTPEGLEQLCTTVRRGLNQLIHQACSDHGSHCRQILDAVLGGNPTMLQLAAGMDPSPLGRIPFRVDLEGSSSHPASQFGLHTNPSARVYIPPILHAFIGTDVTAGMLMSGEFFNDNARVLYLDAGTNGEIAVNNLGRRVAASTAAGPAFEGATLTSGMRATLGAVSAAYTDGYTLQIETIGELPAKGICGSGIVDLLACLLQLGIVQETGRMYVDPGQHISPELQGMLYTRNGQPAVRLRENEDVVFTQEDVREIQLCKGAIRATIDILLSESGLSPQDLESIIIAGGFGYHLNPDSLERIGLIPAGSTSKVGFAGNASRSGCVWLLNDITYRRYLESLAENIAHVSTADLPGFMDSYINAMELPGQAGG